MKSSLPSPPLRPFTAFREAVIRRARAAGFAVLALVASVTHAAAPTFLPYSWGNNGNGALGIGSTSPSNVPVAVTTTGALAGKSIVGVSSGQFFSLAVTADGLVFAWGDNNNGQLGNNNAPTLSLVPVAVNTAGVLAGKTITQVAAGDSFAAALDSAGKVYTWGYNGFGALGNNSANFATSPVPVAVSTTGVLAGKTVTKIAAGGNSGTSFCLALTSDGKVFAWGSNASGQLGRAGSDSGVPVAVDMTGVLAGLSINDIAAGGNHALAAGSDGKLYSWGLNNLSQLGTGASGGSSTVPVAVSLTGPLATKIFYQVAAGYIHSVALANGGEIYAWGDGSQGQLGQGTNASSSVPVAVVAGAIPAAKQVNTIGAGYDFSLALAYGNNPGGTASASVYAWGNNSNGALGVTTGSSPSPVAVTSSGVLNGLDLVALSTGASATRSLVSGYLFGPSISSITPSQTVTVGSPASFTVVATGAQLTYQWQKNSVNIPGANGATYSIASTVLGDAASYAILVTNPAGTASSSTQLTVNAPSAPVITTQPVSQTVNAGTSASFNVVATGIGLSYQWTKGGSNIAGANSAAYTIPTTVVTDSGNYAVVVTNSGGSVTSNTAVLSVSGTPVITVQPTSANVNAGNGVSFSVTAVGGSLTYQWFKNGTTIAGANAASFNIPGVSLSDAGSYTITVTNSSGSVTSNAAILTVNALPSISSHPASQTVTVGASASFAVIATGSPLTYQWKKGGVNIAGAIAATYTIPTTVLGDAGSYTVDVTNAVGTVTSNAATLTVNSITAPNITTQPVNQTVTVGASASFSVTATGTSLTYQWNKSVSTIVGANAATYTIPATVLGDAGSYTVTITNAGGSVTSNAATLTVNLLPAPVITTQPASQTVTVGNSASFTVVATGTALTYQWSKGGTTIVGANASTYPIAATVLGDAGSYTVTVTNSGGSITSNAATLTVNAAPPPPPPPPPPLLNQSIAFGPLANRTFGDAPFAISPTASSGLAVTVSVSSGPATLSGSTVTLTGAGSVTLVATQSGNVSFNAAAPVLQSFTVAKAPAAVVITNFTRTFDGTPKPITVATTPANLLTTVTYNGSATPPTAAGTYTVTAVIVDANYAGTATVTLLIQVPLPVITVDPTSRIVFSGEATTFNVVATSNPAATYQWRFNGQPIPGATAAGFSLPAATPEQAGTYTVVVTNPAGSVTSAPATLTVRADQRLLNFSTRAQVGNGDSIVIGGFVIDGLTPRPILIRAVGPTLARFNLTGVLARPALRVLRDGVPIGANTGWSTAPNAADIETTAAALGAFALPAGSADSALLLTLAPGAYTATINSVDAVPGLALLEVYDTARTPPGLVNLSTRGIVGVNSQVFITGFVLGGNTPKKILVRAVGPTLAGFGVTGAIADPQVQLLRGTTVLATNDNWGNDPEVAATAAQTGAFPLPPGSRDAALVTTLESGAYTLVVSGVGAASGIVLVEVYQAP